MAETEQQAKSDTKKEVVHEKQPEVGPGLEAGFFSSGVDHTLVQRALADPPSAPPEAILHLQRMVGNQSVLRLTGHSSLQRSVAPPIYGIQAKLMVGSPYDNYEQEADRVASQVMSIPASSPTSLQRYAITPLAQRPVLRHPTLHRLVQAKSDGSFEAGDSFESRLSQSRGSGSPLPEPTRNFMEERFGADFGHVRVHTGSEAVQLNRDVSAQAFTHGSDIYFGAGKFNPDSDSGKHLLAHELTHTIQQGTGGIQTKRLVQRKGTIQDLLYPQLKAGIMGKSDEPTDWSSLLKTGAMTGVKIAANPAVLMSLAMEIMAFISADFAEWYDFLGKAKRYVQLGITIINTLAKAWAAIPKPIRTLILYAVGNLSYIIGSYARLGEHAILPIYITDESTKEYMGKATLTKVSDTLTSIWGMVWGSSESSNVESESPKEDSPKPKPLSPPPDLLEDAQESLLSPQLKDPSTKFTKESGGSDESQPSSKGDEEESDQSTPKPQAPKEQPKPSIASLDLSYFKLYLRDMQTRYSKEKSDKEEAKAGGLYFSGGIEFNMFGMALDNEGPELSADVTVPWGWKEMPLVNLKASNIRLPGFKLPFLAVQGINIQEVAIANEGLTSAKFKIEQVNIGNGAAIVTDLGASWSKQGLTFTGGALNMDLFGFKLAAQGFNLSLGPDGEFIQAGLDSLSVGANDTLNVQKILLSKPGGKDGYKLDIDRARIKLPDYLKSGDTPTEVIFSKISADKSGFEGKGAAGPLDIEVIKERLFIEKAKIEGEITKTEGWSVHLEAGVNVKGDAETQSKQGVGKSLASGNFDITYKRKQGQGKVTGGLKNGQMDFTLAKVLRLHAQGVEYDIEARTLKIPEAGADVLLNNIPGLENAGIIESTGQGFVLGPAGFDFKSIAINYVDSKTKLPKAITLFEGVKLENISAYIGKQANKYTIKATTDLNVDFPTANVKGGLKGANVTFTTDEGVSGGFAAMELSTSWFKLIINGGKLTKEGLHIDSAALVREAKSESEGSSKPKDTYGLQSSEMSKFDQFPITTELKFQANDIWIKKGKGLTVGSVETTLKKLGFKMMGVEGGMEFPDKENEEGSAYLRGGFKFPPKVPGWPFRLDVFYPIVPPGGIDLTGYVEAGGGLEAGVNMDAKLGRNKEKPGAWDLRFDGGPYLNGSLYGEVGAGIYFGSSALIAIGADLFLRFPLVIGAESKVKGGLTFDPHAKEKRFKPTQDFAMHFQALAEAKAQIGLKLNVKFLYFFNKTLYTIQFKEWVLGNFKFAGDLKVDEEGRLKFTRDEMKWSFMGKNSDTKPDGPEVEARLPEVEALAAKAGYKLATAEQDKAEALQEVQSEPKSKQQEVQREHDEEITTIRTKYISAIIEQYGESAKEARERIESLTEKIKDLTKDKAKHTKDAPAEKKQQELLEQLGTLKEQAKEDEEARQQLEQMRSQIEKGKDKQSKATLSYFDKHYDKIKEYEAKITSKTAEKTTAQKQLDEHITPFLTAKEIEQKKMAMARIEEALVKSRKELEEQKKNRSGLMDKLISIKNFFKKIKNLFKKKETAMIPEDDFVSGLHQENVEELEEGREKGSTEEQEKAQKAWAKQKESVKQ